MYLTLEEYRKEKKLTKTELAKKLGVSVALVSKYTKNYQKSPTMDKAILLEIEMKEDVIIQRNTASKEQTIEMLTTKINLEYQVNNRLKEMLDNANARATSYKKAYEEVKEKLIAIKELINEK